MKKGSPATSLNELPRPLVSVLPGFGLRVLVSVLEALTSGDPQRAALAGPPLLPCQEAPGVAGAQQRTRHAGALPPATGDGRCARSLVHPLRAPARHPPGALRLSAAIVGSIPGPGLPLAVGRLGHPARGGVVRRLG